MATSRTLIAYVLLLSIVLLSCPDLYKCERDMSDSRTGAAAVETRETVDGKRCAIRYIIGEPMYCCTNGCWDKLADCQKACKP